MKKIKFIYAIALALFLVQGCKEDLLVVENDNQPDFDKVFSNGAALENLASGLYVTIYNGEHAGGSVQPMLAVASDNVIVIDATKCMVNSPKDKLVVLQGLDDFIVVDTKDVLLICSRDKEQSIKEYVAEVKRNKGDKYI